MVVMDRIYAHDMYEENFLDEDLTRIRAATDLLHEKATSSEIVCPMTCSNRRMGQESCWWILTGVAKKAWTSTRSYHDN
jgi:hypothetical protein